MLVLICALLCRRDLLTLDLTVCRQCPVEDTQPRPLFWSHMRPGTITDKTYLCGLRIWKWASPTSPQGWCRMMLGDLWSQSFILALYEVPLWLQKYCLEGISFGNLIHFRCCCVILVYIWTCSGFIFVHASENSCLNYQQFFDKPLCRCLLLIIYASGICVIKFKLKMFFVHSFLFFFFHFSPKPFYKSIMCHFLYEYLFSVHRCYK